MEERINENKWCGRGKVNMGEKGLEREILLQKK